MDVYTEMIPRYLSLLLQGSEAAAGGGQERLQLQLQGVQLLDSNSIIFGPSENGRVPGTQLHVLHGFKIVVFQRRAVF